ncbi:hypothetical protein ABZU75_19275 [Streptosporangium sp. NPDC005286]|uniref:hypothetical protein n=1 Tax=Streptosporangium sp. NPDC005286 TaxID=3154463 RepID=UPI0033AB2C26
MTSNVAHPPRISPTAIEGLLDLRVILETALVSAKLPSNADKHFATIALDGACEKVTGLAAKELGLSVALDLEKNVNKVVEHLRKQSWNFQGVGSILDLHRARNNAQHHGIRVNPTQLTSWCTVAERFVRSVVNEVFGANLFTIWRANAIANIDISNTFQLAEQSFNNGDYQSAVAHASSALDVAVEEWRVQRRNIGQGPVHVPTQQSPNPQWQAVNARFDSLDELLLTPFSADAGEALWVQWITGEKDVPYTHAECERVLDFTFWWIVRWESFSATLTVDREQQWLISRRSIRSDPSHPANIASAEIEHVWQGRWGAEFILSNLPPEESFDGWRAHVYQLLREIAHTAANYWQITEYGSIKFEWDPKECDADTLVRLVNNALKEAETSIQHAEAAQKKAESERVRAETNLRDAIRGVVPSWVEDVSLGTRYATGIGLSCELKLNIDHHASSRLRDLLRTHSDVNECFWSLEGNLVIFPAPPPARLIEMIHDSREEVESILATSSKTRNSYNEDRQQMIDQLQQAVSKTKA